MLDVVSHWCTTWKISINVNKTKVMHFRPQSFATSEFIFQCEMTLNVLVPHTPLPYINIGYIMDVYSLLYTLYVILPAILTLVIKLPNARLAALASSFALSIL
jgi:hypothetical protein